MNAEIARTLSFGQFIRQLKKEGHFRGLPINIVLAQKASGTLPKIELDKVPMLDMIEQTAVWQMLSYKGAGPKFLKELSQIVRHIGLDWPATTDELERRKAA